MRQLTPEEASQQLAELIEAAVHGERIVIARDDDQKVQLLPLAPAGRARHAGSAKGLITLRDDFDAPLDDFAEYRQ
jgi:antitoxin (DNA-binding transcriptional repressor) of toxin-antitoxin stability system